MLSSVKTKMVEKVIMTDAVQKFIIVEDDNYVYFLDEDVAEKLKISKNVPVDSTWLLLLQQSDLVIHKKTKTVYKSRWF